MKPLASSQDVLGLVVCFFYIMLVVFCLIKGRRCRKHIGSIVLTQEFADTAPERGTSYGK
jgi:hypothetical protein